MTNGQLKPKQGGSLDTDSDMEAEHDSEAAQAVYEEGQRVLRRQQVERSQLDIVAGLTNISLFSRPKEPFRANSSQNTNVLSGNDVKSIEAQMAIALSQLADTERAVQMNDAGVCLRLTRSSDGRYALSLIDGNSKSTILTSSSQRNLSREAVKALETFEGFVEDDIYKSDEKRIRSLKGHYHKALLKLTERLRIIRLEAKLLQKLLIKEKVKIAETRRKVRASHAVIAAVALGVAALTGRLTAPSPKTGPATTVQAMDQALQEKSQRNELIWRHLDQKKTVGELEKMFKNKPEWEEALDDITHSPEFYLLQHDATTNKLEAHHEVTAKIAETLNKGEISGTLLKMLTEKYIVVALTYETKIFYDDFKKVRNPEAQKILLERIGLPKDEYFFTQLKQNASTPEVRKAVEAKIEEAKKRAD